MSKYAEDVGHYWKTSSTSADTWIDKVLGLIKKHGGIPRQSYAGSDLETQQAAYMISFSLDGDDYRISWPVLESKTGNARAAKIQAATMLYHSVKSRIMEAKVIGNRTAFFSFLQLQDGRTAVELENSEIGMVFAPMLNSANDTIELSGNTEMIEGTYALAGDNE